jgi:hypothetical protein
MVLMILLTASQVYADGYIADHTVATEAVLRQIPASAIQAAKDNLHIAYFHSSHGSRVISGMEGLKDYKAGDGTLFAFTDNSSPQAHILDIDDHNVSSNDLSAKEGLQSNGHTQWYNETVTYLDDPDNSRINVVMWSWCDPAGHNHQRYLDNMEDLIGLYGPGGTKLAPSGTRTVPVTFVFMTGHPTAGDGESASVTSAYHCHTLVTEHCRQNNRYCIDYWGIETHNMDGTYYPHADDNGVNEPDGFQFYLDWQTKNPDDYFENGCVHCSSNQDLTCNRVAYASWWMWARIAGWVPEGTSQDDDPPQEGDDTPAPSPGSSSGDGTADTSSSGCFIGTIKG